METIWKNARYVGAFYPSKNIIDGLFCLPRPWTREMNDLLKWIKRFIRELVLVSANVTTTINIDFGNNMTKAYLFDQNEYSRLTQNAWKDRWKRSDLQKQLGCCWSYGNCEDPMIWIPFFKWLNVNCTWKEERKKKLFNGWENLFLIQVFILLLIS